MQLNFKDIVIDTNVLVHSGNPNERCFEASVELLSSILDSNCVICIDKKRELGTGYFDGLISQEYDKLLGIHTPLATNFISKMFRTQRVVEISKNPGQKRKKIIEQKIRKKNDRVFVGVTCNSHDKLLASHDFEDFQKSKRQFLKSKLKINILCSDEICDNQHECSKTCSK